MIKIEKHKNGVDVNIEGTTAELLAELTVVIATFKRKMKVSIEQLTKVMLNAMAFDFDEE